MPCFGDRSRFRPHFRRPAADAASAEGPAVRRRGGGQARPGARPRRGRKSRRRSEEGGLRPLRQQGAKAHHRVRGPQAPADSDEPRSCRAGARNNAGPRAGPEIFPLPGHPGERRQWDGQRQEGRDRVRRDPAPARRRGRPPLLCRHDRPEHGRVPDGRPGQAQKVDREGQGNGGGRIRRHAQRRVWNGRGARRW